MLALLLCLCYDTYHLLIMPPILPCQTSNPPCPSKPLFGYVTTFLSPSYSIVSCRWSWRLLHVGTCLCWDITISLILINASRYLVKGGRLGLMPGVLFHSCRPSFCHTSVMFLDFVFLTRSGLWEPLDSSLWIKLLQQGPTLVLTFAIIILKLNNKFA